MSDDQKPNLTVLNFETKQERQGYTDRPTVNQVLDHVRDENPDDVLMVTIKDNRLMVYASGHVATWEHVGILEQAKYAIIETIRDARE